MLEDQEKYSQLQLIALQDEVARLRARALSDNEKIERFRSLLIQARSALKEVDRSHAQQITVTSRTTSLRPWLRPNGFRKKMLVHIASNFARLLSKPAGVNDNVGTVRRSHLEASILAHARRQIRDIDSVYVEFVPAPHVEGAINWRLAGVQSGRADRDAAMMAVLTAVAAHRCCTMARD